ncbi:MAG TPA: DUF2993 domain-containing protein [Armatimonadetes bacterium]|nr:DUF2993 domain-containing protein [Armatimonadota bacterium]
MQTLAVLIITALTAGSASRFDLAERLRLALAAQLGTFEELEVEVQAAARPQLVSGNLRGVTIRVHRFDATALPWDTFSPTPRPRRLKGRLDRLTLVATEAQFQNLTVSRLTLTGKGITYDLLDSLLRRRIVLTGYREATLEAHFRDGDLDSFLAARIPQLRQAHVRFEPGQVVVTGQVVLGAASLPVTVRGRLQVVQRRELHLTEAQVQVGNLTLPPETVKSLLAQANPLLDVAALLPVPLALEEIELKAGEAILRGHFL